jgi:hypothetical protein
MTPEQEAMVKLREQFMSEVYFLADADSVDLKSMGYGSMADALRDIVARYRKETRKVLKD